jgi:acetyl esterase/lipase
MRNDEAYANSAHIPGGDSYPDRWAEASGVVRTREAATGQARLDQSYGADPRQRFDLYYPQGRPKGLVVLFHGGYWRALGREDFAHLSTGCTAAGWAVVLPSYRLAPQATIPQITGDAAAALAAAAAQVPGPIAVTGHSAGGHLAARMLCAALAPDLAARLTTCVPVSPLADLRPLIDTSMNAVLRLDQESASAESPCLLTPLKGVAVTVWVGADERPAFLDQARWLTQAWAGSRLHIAPGRHHFDVIEAYEDPHGALVRDLTGAKTGRD